MTILFIASEMVPFCKTGGLADVIGDLPRALAALGHDVTVMLPAYAAISRQTYPFKPVPGTLDIPVGAVAKPLALETLEWDGVTVHLLRNDEYFDRDGLYGDLNGDWPDNGERFAFFCRGCLEAVRFLGLEPDIIHAHDWQAGLVPAYIRTLYAGDGLISRASTLLTIHNLGYQGLFGRDVFEATHLPPELWDWRCVEYWGKVSYLKAGIVYADAVSTVSRTYADEIARPPLGFGMEGVLAERRRDLHGIVNGIDTDAWNPATDSLIPARYSADDCAGKAVCRAALLKLTGMSAKANEPVFGMVTRLDDQKGLDILEEGIGHLMSLGIRLVILGTGTQKHHEAMEAIAGRYPSLVHVFLRFDNSLAHLIYAGADAFLMPSRYEPCGLGQLIAMRYGTLPVVHATGGLADTVTDIDDFPRKGDGFSFTGYTPEMLLDAVTRAVRAFRASGRNRWLTAVRRVMTRDLSWHCAAEQYVILYERIRNRIPDQASKK